MLSKHSVGTNHENKLTCNLAKVISALRVWAIQHWPWLRAWNCVCELISTQKTNKEKKSTDRDWVIKNPPLWIEKRKEKKKLPPQLGGLLSASNWEWLHEAHRLYTFCRLTSPMTTAACQSVKIFSVEADTRQRFLLAAVASRRQCPSCKLLHSYSISSSHLPASSDAVTYSGRTTHLPAIKLYLHSSHSHS